MIRRTLRLLTAVLAALSLVAEARAAARSRAKRPAPVDPTPETEPVAPRGDGPCSVEIEFARDTDDGWRSYSWSQDCASRAEANAVLAGWTFGGGGGDC